MKMEPGRGAVNIFEAQHRVFENEEKRKSIQDMFSFVITNAAIFRYFAEHLPKDLYKVWDAAAGEKENKIATEELGIHYEAFRNEIISTLEALDPETVTALSEAVENKDVDVAAEIFKTYFAIKDKAEEELREGSLNELAA
jgi:oligoendopeptidase F